MLIHKIKSGEDMIKAFILLLSFICLCSCIGKDVVYNNRVTARCISSHSIYSKALKLAIKLHSIKKQEYLLYRDFNDLFETCVIIVKYNKLFNSHFTTDEIAAIILVESRFNRFALNKVDGGKGLCQVMILWQKVLPWYQNPYDKKESIAACYYILDILYNKHQNKQTVFKRYNGSGIRAELYSKKIMKLSKTIERL